MAVDLCTMCGAYWECGCRPAPAKVIDLTMDGLTKTAAEMQAARDSLRRLVLRTRRPLVKPWMLE